MSENKVNLKVDWCSYEAAKYAVMRWHYSKCMPIGKMIKIGAWENSKYIGCVLFGRGVARNIMKPYGLKQTDGCELVRIALSLHKTPTSKILSIALAIFKKRFPKMKLIVSYSDLNQEHIGTIYQATNWIYCGISVDQGGFVKINGKIMHGRSIGAKYGTRSLPWLRKNIDPSANTVSTCGKNKYLMPLNRKIRRQILPLSKPYPKRPPEGTDLSDQDKKGGSIPTRTLQNIIESIKSNLTPDLLKPEYRAKNKSNPMYGHCYVATEALFHSMGEHNFKPHYGKGMDGITHWWLQDSAGNRLDVTKEQYTSQGKVPPYNNGKRASFLTNEPSKRCIILMNRIKKEVVK
jgi:hypothetical protein